MQPVAPDTQTTTLGTQPGSPSTLTTSTGMKPAPAATDEEGAGVRPSSLNMQAGLPVAENIPAEAAPAALGTHEDVSLRQEPAVPQGSSDSSSVSGRSVEMVEALQQMAEFSHLYSGLKERVAQLEATKLDRTELEELRLLFPERGGSSGGTGGGVFGTGTRWVGGSSWSEPGHEGESPSLTACPLGPCPSR